MSIVKTVLVSVVCDHDGVCLEAHRVEVEVAPPVDVGSSVDARARVLAGRSGWTITTHGDYCPRHKPLDPPPDDPDGGVPAVPSGGAPALSAEAQVEDAPEMVMVR